MTTPKQQIAFPEVAVIRKGAARKNTRKNGRTVATVGDDLQDRFRVVFFPGVDPAILDAFLEACETLTPTRIRAMLPFRSVWQAFSSYNEAHSSGRMIARADDERYLSLRDPRTGNYLVRAGKPHRPYTPGEGIAYERDGRTYELKFKPTSRLRLFLPEIGRLVTFTLKTTSFYDRENLKEQLGAIQAVAEALSGENAPGGNAAGIPFTVYRAEREVLWNRPDGGALRVSKWLVHLEPDPGWAAAATGRLARFALSGVLSPAPLRPLEVSGSPGEIEEEDAEENETEAGEDLGVDG